MIDKNKLSTLGRDGGFVTKWAFEIYKATEPHGSAAFLMNVIV